MQSRKDGWTMQSNGICDYCIYKDERPFCYYDCFVHLFYKDGFGDAWDCQFTGIEVEPVIHCKDCKHWNCDQLSEAEIEWHDCNDPLTNNGQVLTYSEWYCPNGKRRAVR